MPKEYSRSTRVAEQLRRELSELVRFEVKDPGARDVTITEVSVSKDITHAKVFFSMLEDDAEHIAAAEAALHRAAGFLRRELGKVLRMRIVPELHFQYDRSLAEGVRMDALIAEARRKDRERGSED